jgi:hypothetical protein
MTGPHGLELLQVGAGTEGALPAAGDDHGTDRTVTAYLRHEAGKPGENLRVERVEGARSIDGRDQDRAASFGEERG